MSAGVSLELTEPPTDGADGFARWHDEEHVPAQMARAGASTAIRFLAVQGRPRSLVVYELDQVDTQPETGGENLLRGSSSPSRTMLDASGVRNRRHYVTVQDRRTDADGPNAARALLSVGMTVRRGQEPDFDTWFEEEHIPDLLAIDGWLRCRRFHRISGAGPKHLALHELRGLEVLDDPAFREAPRTAWRDRVMKDRIDFERRIYTLVRHFD